MLRQDVSFDSWGERCAGWLYRPAEAGEPVPCVVLGHGLTAFKEMALDRYAERFAAGGVRGAGLRLPRVRR